MATITFEGLKKLNVVEARELAIPMPNSELLLPIGPWLTQDSDKVITEMWYWRCKNASSFFYDQPPTFESFSDYLDSGPISSRERILFLVAREKLIVGHMGLVARGDNCATIDNVLRGRALEAPDGAGIMQRALEGMMAWANESYGIYKFDLEVRSDNDKAMRFYERCGFSRAKDLQFGGFRKDSQKPKPQSKNVARIIMSKTLSPQP